MTPQKKTLPWLLPGLSQENLPKHRGAKRKKGSGGALSDGSEPTPAPWVWGHPLSGSGGRFTHTLRDHFLGEMGNAMGCRKRVFCDFTRGIIGCGRRKAVAGKGVGLSDLRRNKNCEIEGSGVRKMSYHTIHTLAVFVRRL